MQPTEIKVHPAAAVFPMLSDDELADLAEDIKANGLLHAIVLDANGVLIDGRNRLAACRLAGVDPTFTTLDGHEPIAFILAQNVKRRHLTEGQRAIGTVRAVGLSNFDKKGAKRDVAYANDLHSGAVSHAVVIVEYTPELADAVMQGTMPFTKAWEQARDVRDARERREAVTERERVRLDRIQTVDGDLHLMVTEGRLSLDDAVAVLDRREQDQLEEQKRHVRYMIESMTMLRTLLYRQPEQILDEWVAGASSQQEEGPFSREIWTPDGLDRLASDVAALAGEMRRREG